MWVSSTASLRLAGSLSEPLATTTARRRRSATARSFRALETCAPPRPRRPLSSIASSRRAPRVAAGHLQRAVDAPVLGEGQRAAVLDPAQEPRKAARAAHHVTSWAAAVPTTAPPALDPERQAQLQRARTGRRETSHDEVAAQPDHPAAVEIRPTAGAEPDAAGVHLQAAAGKRLAREPQVEAQRRAGDVDLGGDVDLRAPVGRRADLPGGAVQRGGEGQRHRRRSADGARDHRRLRRREQRGRRAGAARPARLQRALQREHDDAHDRGGRRARARRGAARPAPASRAAGAPRARRRRPPRTRRSAAAATPSARRSPCPGRAARRPASRHTRPSAPPARRAGPAARAGRWSRSARRAGRRRARRSRATAGGSATRAGRPRRGPAGARRGPGAR